MNATVEETIERLQTSLREQLPDVRMEFTIQQFANHTELLVYVLNESEFAEVRARCDELSTELEKDRAIPEIWIMARIWTGPWPGGEAELELLSQRREEFRRKHSSKPPLKAGV